MLVSLIDRFGRKSRSKNLRILFKNFVQAVYLKRWAHLKKKASNNSTKFVGGRNASWWKTFIWLDFKLCKMFDSQLGHIQYLQLSRFNEWKSNWNVILFGGERLHLSDIFYLEDRLKDWLKDFYLKYFNFHFDLMT